MTLLKYYIVKLDACEWHMFAINFKEAIQSRHESQESMESPLIEATEVKQKGDSLCR